MIKVRTKNTWKIVSLALAMIMCLSMALPTFAAPPVNSSGDEDNPADAAVTKIFQMPEGTDTPDVEFIFELEPIMVDDEDYDEDEENMPLVKDVKIELDEDKVSTIDEVKKYVIESDKIFKDIDWPHAGVYTYEITEKNTYTIDDPKVEKFIFSQAKYELNVYVYNGKNGLYVAYVTAKIIIEDESVEGDENGKVDPTPEENRTDGGLSEMVFTNTYAKTNGKPDITDPEDPDDPDPEKPDPEVVWGNKVMTISKTVEGELGNRNLDFIFNVTVDIPKVGIDADEQEYYAAYILEDDNGTKKTISGRLDFPVNPSEDREILLKHNQLLVFTDMHVGASFVVTEDGTQNYTPSYILTLNGEQGTKVTGPKNGELSTLRKLIGEKLNLAAYTNTYDMVTPTGISVDNLPYIAILIAAAFALAGYITVKFRSKAKTNA